MRKPIKIGETEYPSKKSALEHYKNILNSYDFGEKLNESDSNDILDLIELHPNPKEKIGIGIKEIRIGKARYNTKSFELVRLDKTTTLFSYTRRINMPKSKFAKFSQVCRVTIQKDLFQVKQNYFDKFSKKGRVKCQETGELLKWEDLNIDHRQPNTFSVIVDRFIEVNHIDVEKVKYRSVLGGPDEFDDNELRDKFRKYHKEKANLRIVSKSLNLGRSYQARIKRQKKDLKIK